MIYGSVCSGIEAATVAWGPLGWKPAWFAEIDPFCCAVLAHHYPLVRNYGDFTQIGPDAGPIDTLVGGTPCQSFSVAGRRGGLDDARGNLAIEFCRLAGRLRPRWVVWENVPGVLSSNGGRDFGAILGALAELGYGCAWRVLDAQYFGVPQRRRRVFVVGHLGDWRRAAAVLLEREGLCRDTPARRKARQATPGCAVYGAEVGPAGGRFTDLAPTLDARCRDSAIRNQVGLLVFGGGNTSDAIEVATTLTHHGTRQDFETETFCVEVAPPLLAGANRFPGTCVDTCESLIVHTLRGEGFDASEDGTGRGTPLVAGTLKANHGGGGFGSDPSETFIPILELGSRTGVRRLTPRECERLQGFDDDYTLIPNYRKRLRADEIEEMAAYLGIPLEEARRVGATPDGPRYKAIGNSMAVPVMRWIGRRIEQVDQLL